MLEIQKNVPIPPARGNRGAGASVVDSLRTMEIGDSFVAPEKTRTHYSWYGKLLGFKFSVRKIEDGQIRVWRAA